MTEYRTRFSKLLSIALLLSCVAAVPAARANLILNGSFESPIVPSSSLSCGVSFNTDCQGYYSPDQPGFPSGGPSDISGWSVIGKGGASGIAVVLQLGNGYTEVPLHFDAQDGTQSLDLTGEGNQGANGVKQSVSTISGARYRISFYLGHQDTHALGYAGLSSLDFYINQDLPIPFFNLDVISQDVDWTQFVYAFNAPTNLTTFAFINTTPVRNNYTGLDNVVLSAVPEPGSLALLGVGFGAFILLQRRRSTRA